MYGGVEKLHTMIVVKKLYARMSVLFLDEKLKLNILKVSPDAREQIMKIARIFIGTSLHFLITTV